MTLTADPRVHATRYDVRPTAWDRMHPIERRLWVVSVEDAGAAGWAVRTAASPRWAANRRGHFIHESSHPLSNKTRRYPLEEALAIALKVVDHITVSGATPEQAATHYEQITASKETP